MQSRSRATHQNKKSFGKSLYFFFWPHSASFRCPTLDLFYFFITVVLNSSFRAARAGHFALVRKLLVVLSVEERKKILTKSVSNPLLIAAQQGRTRVVAVLLEFNAPVDIPNVNDEATPLFMAAENGCLSTVACLVENDANIEAKRNTGSTPLFIASQVCLFQLVP